MSDGADLEIRQIVQRVIRQAVGLNGPAAAPSAPPALSPDPAKTEAQPAVKQTVAFGADHGGFELKEALKADAAALGFEIIDMGTTGKEAVDYPDFAHKVAALVGAGKAWRGIVVDGAGIGSCIVANKIPGVRAGMAYDYSSAVNGREHNDTNVLTLGAGLIGANLARLILRTWLATPFAGGRHAPRVDKITAVEKQYLK